MTGTRLTMRRRALRGWAGRGLLLAVVLALPACTAPDRWRVFDNRIERHLDAEAGRARVQFDGRAAPSATAANGSATAQPAATQPTLWAPPLDGGPVELSIEAAVMLAMQNNRELQVERIQPVIDGAYEQIERGRFDAELFAEASYLRERTSETSRSTGSQFDVVGDDIEAAAGIRQTLPTGTEVEAVVEQGRSSSNRAPEQQTARLGLTVTQALLRGFGAPVNLAVVRQAKIEAVASLYELRGFAEALLAETEIAYWRYVLAEQEIAIFEKSLEVAKEQLAQVERRIKVGVLAETEAAAARAEVARREQALIDARSTLNARRLQLLRLVNPNADGQLDSAVTAVTSPRIDADAVGDLEERLQLADQARPDLNEARLRLEQARLETIVTRNGLLPRLEVFMTLGKTGYEDTFAGSFREMKSNTYDVTAGVRFNQVLGNRTARARDLQARASRRQAAQAIENLRQLVQYDVRLAVNELERTREQVGASAATRAFQQRALLAEQQRFDVGSSTSLLVAQAQRDLLASRIAEVEAVVAYRIALVNLYLAEGSLLERRGFGLEGREAGRP